MFGIGPGRQARDDVELSEEAADDLVGVGLGAEAIELRQDPGERPFYFVDRRLRVELTLPFETALALDELFAVETGKGMDNGIALRTRIGEET